VKTIRDRKGLTLVEMLVAMGIAGGIAIIAGRYLMNSTRFASRTQDQFELEKAKVILIKELSRVFERARYVRAGGTGAGAGAGGFTVNGTGWVTFGADLRPCKPEGGPNTNAFFNPVTANTSNPNPATTISSFTLVSLVCCPGGPTGPSFMNVQNPWGGAPIRVDSACRRGPGLTIQYKRGADVRTKCIGDYGATAPIGGQPVTGAGIVAMRFGTAAARADQSKVFHRRDNLFYRNEDGDVLVRPNTGTYTPVVAQNPAGRGDPRDLYYLSFFSNDNISTGERNTPLQARSDQNVLTEMLSTLGNVYDPTPGRTNSGNRVINCGRGVQD
jgi:prepilin-type N-terminal cleavage/methylation domain-containing protein